MHFTSISEHKSVFLYSLQLSVMWTYLTQTPGVQVGLFRQFQVVYFGFKKTLSAPWPCLSCTPIYSPIFCQDMTLHDILLIRLACTGWSHSSHSRSLQMRIRPHHRTWLHRSACQSHTHCTCARSRKAREMQSLSEISWTHINCFATLNTPEQNIKSNVFI